VEFWNRLGPLLRVGYNTHPGRKPSVRIDNGPIHLVNEKDPQGEIVNAMSKGQKLYATYTTWPSKGGEMTVDLGDFNRAYAELLKGVEETKHMGRDLTAAHSATQ
jgi:hypothetical protein